MLGSAHGDRALIIIIALVGLTHRAVVVHPDFERVAPSRKRTNRLIQRQVRPVGRGCRDIRPIPTSSASACYFNMHRVSRRRSASLIHRSPVKVQRLVIIIRPCVTVARVPCQLTDPNRNLVIPVRRLIRRQIGRPARGFLCDHDVIHIGPCVRWPANGTVACEYEGYPHLRFP